MTAKKLPANPKMIDYLQARNSVRAFLPKPIPREVLERVINAGCEAPSWSNTQPYRISVAEGALRDSIANALCAEFDKGNQPARRDYDVPAKYPPELHPRRVACGFGLYGALGIEREDMAGRTQQMRRNFHFFDAPTEIYVFTHEALGAYATLDAGAFLQSLMLAALDEGLGTCAQGAAATWTDVVKPFFDVPEGYRMLCGIAIGYPAEDKVNGFRPQHLGFRDLEIKAR